MTPAEFAAVEAGFAERLGRALPGHSPESPGLANVRKTVAAARAEGCREAAVLVLLFPGQSGPATVLTLRSTDLRNHGGQVALPGGAVDDGESLEEAAYREAQEELGLAETPVFLGRLSPLHVPPSGFCLNPVVASTPRRPEFHPDSREVAEVLEVNLDALATTDALLEEERVIRGERRTVHYYAVSGHKVWGATGLVLSELAEVWRGVRAQLAGEDPAAQPRRHGKGGLETRAP